MGCCHSLTLLNLVEVLRHHASAFGAFLFYAQNSFKNSLQKFLLKILEIFLRYSATLKNIY